MSRYSVTPNVRALRSDVECAAADAAPFARAQMLIIPPQIAL